MPTGAATSALLAAVPLFWLLLGLGVLRMPAWRACVVGLAATMVVAAFAWKVPAEVVALSAVEGALLGLADRLGIFAAISPKPGVRHRSMEKIKALRRRLRRPAVQGCARLGFGGFLEARRLRDGGGHPRGSCHRWLEPRRPPWAASSQHRPRRLRRIACGDHARQGHRRRPRPDTWFTALS
jgi:hypothetical protein